MIFPMARGLGPLGRTRKYSSGSFTPADLAGLRLWLRADALSLSDGDPVGAWPDSGPDGRDAAASGVDRPTYHAAVINGLPAVTFSNHRLDFAALGTLAAVTIAAAYSYDTFVGPLCYLMGGASTGVSPGGSGFNLLLLGSGSGGDYLEATTSPTGWGYSTWQPAHLYRGGAEMAYNHAGAPSGFPLSRVGDRTDSNLPFDGRLAELLVYDAALSPADRGKVESYLSTKYGL